MNPAANDLEARLAGMDVGARAHLIRTLLGGDDADQQAIVRTLLETGGPQLTELKAALDDVLPKLVWADIDDTQRRHTVLSHFAREAAPGGALRVLDVSGDLFAATRLEGTVEAFLRYDALYPEHAFLVVGGDASFQHGLRGKVKAVLPAGVAKTSVGAAVQAAKLGAIDRTALLAVVKDAEREVGRLPEAERKARRAELMADIEAARRLAAS